MMIGLPCTSRYCLGRATAFILLPIPPAKITATFTGHHPRYSRFVLWLADRGVAERGVAGGGVPGGSLAGREFAGLGVAEDQLIDHAICGVRVDEVEVLVSESRD